jgi:hypothetical protein
MQKLSIIRELADGDGSRLIGGKIQLSHGQLVVTKSTCSYTPFLIPPGILIYAWNGFKIVFEYAN